MLVSSFADDQARGRQRSIGVAAWGRGDVGETSCFALLVGSHKDRSNYRETGWKP